MASVIQHVGKRMRNLEEVLRDEAKINKTNQIEDAVNDANTSDKRNHDIFIDEVSDDEGTGPD